MHQSQRSPHPNPRKTLWLGLGLIDNLEQNCIQRLVQARNTDGPFNNLSEFKQRVEPGLEQLKILIQIGACRCWEKSRKALMWEAHALYGNNKKTRRPNPKTIPRSTQRISTA